MPAGTDTVNQDLEELRAYLETLTFIQIDPRLRSKFSLSEVVQNTLVKAWRDLERIRALDTEGRKCWLRQMLVNNLRDKAREVTAACRDGRLDRSLEEAAAESSC